jgi:hypothetical protein
VLLVLVELVVLLGFKTITLLLAVPLASVLGAEQRLHFCKLILALSAVL